LPRLRFLVVDEAHNSSNRAAAIYLAGKLHEECSAASAIISPGRNCWLMAPTTLLGANCAINYRRWRGDR